MNIKLNCTTLLIFISGVYAVTVEDRLLELERVVKLQSRALENHDDVFQDQTLIVERLKNENDQLKKRLEVLENNMAEKKAESMTNFDTSVQILPESLTNNKSVSRQKDKLPQTLSGDNDQRGKDDADKVRVSRTNHNHMMKRTTHSIKKTEKSNILRASTSSQESLCDSLLIPFLKVMNVECCEEVKGQSSGIAFHAYMTGQRCFHDHEVFVFDTEGVDEGNGYDKRDGIFVVPVTGFYVFTWTLASEWDDWYRADIIINGESTAWITTAKNNEDAASGTVIAHVNVGDHVFIRRVQGTTCTVRDHLTRPTFSGWKLF